MGSDSVENPDEMPDELHEAFKEAKRSLTRKMLMAYGALGALQVLFWLLDRT